jgi:hypothetical protein
MEIKLELQVGFAWCFEKAVVFGDVHAMLMCLHRRNAKNRYGLFLGVVKGLIPKDPYYVLILDFRHTKGFIERQHLRKLGVKKRERKYLQKIIRWCR